MHIRGDDVFQVWFHLRLGGFSQRQRKALFHSRLDTRYAIYTSVLLVVSPLMPKLQVILVSYCGCKWASPPTRVELARVVYQVIWWVGECLTDRVCNMGPSVKRGLWKDGMVIMETSAIIKLLLYYCSSFVTMKDKTLIIGDIRFCSHKIPSKSDDAQLAFTW